jgi:hypothetical protein
VKYLTKVNYWLIALVTYDIEVLKKTSQEFEWIACIKQVSQQNTESHYNSSCNSDGSEKKNTTWMQKFSSK